MAQGEATKREAGADETTRAMIESMTCVESGPHCGGDAPCVHCGRSCCRDCDHCHGCGQVVCVDCSEKQEHSMQPDGRNHGGHGWSG